MRSIGLLRISCVAVFIYNIFFVFVTPFIFNGDFVMVTVATGGGPPDVSAAYCKNIQAIVSVDRDRLCQCYCPFPPNPQKHSTLCMEFVPSVPFGVTNFRFQQNHDIVIVPWPWPACRVSIQFPTILDLVNSRKLLS